MWVVALGVVAVAIGIAIYLVSTAGSSDNGPLVDGVKCEHGEKLGYHVHSWLAIFVEGQRVEVPANVGITSSCLFWLHTHNNTGIVHVEAPSQRDFSLGQFFAVWGKPLSSTALMDQSGDAAHQVKATVNGQPFAGNPADISLSDHATIVVQYGPPFAAAPSYDWTHLSEIPASPQ